MRLPEWDSAIAWALIICALMLWCVSCATRGPDRVIIIDDLHQSFSADSLAIAEARSGLTLPTGYYSVTWAKGDRTGRNGWCGVDTPDGLKGEETTSRAMTVWICDDGPRRLAWSRDPQVHGWWHILLYQAGVIGDHHAIMREAGLTW